MSIGLAVLFESRAVWASSVDVRCPDLPVTDVGELQARARLLLSSAGFESARVGVECDASGTWLVWTDGSRTTIDVHSGVVEGALDAIESRVSNARNERAAAGKGGSSSSAEPTPPGLDNPDSLALGDGSREGSAGDRDAARKGTEEKRPTAIPGAPPPLEGGVSVATTTELWSARLGVGLRVDVGVGIGDELAVVLGQAARLGVPAPADGEITVYDLQAGFAVGAPFRARTGFGVALLGGAERLSDSGFQSTGIWAATASLGARASVQAGAVDLWIGADVAMRSRSLDVKGGSTEVVPGVSGSVSLGCFFPAFTHEATARGGPPRSVGFYH